MAEDETPKSQDVTPETLATMADDLPEHGQHSPVRGRYPILPDRRTRQRTKFSD